MHQGQAGDELRQIPSTGVLERHTLAQVADDLKAESDRQLQVDAARALEIARQILELGEARSDDGVRALGYLAQADALRELGQYAAAVVGYERAGALYVDLEDEVGWARSRIGATLAWRYTGVDQSRLAEIDRARAILRAHGLWLRLARLEQHVGLLTCELGQLDAATEAYSAALDAARHLQPRDRGQEARIQGNLALVWQRKGEYERAATLLSESLEIFQEQGLERQLAMGKAITAQLLADQGHYSRALETAMSARRTFLELGRTTDAAFVGRAAAFCLLALNRLDDAEALASTVIQEFEQCGAAVNVAGTLLLRTGARRRRGLFNEAVADLERALALFKSSDCRGWVAVAQAERAAVLALAGDWETAASESARAARELSALNHTVSAAEAHLLGATALKRLGKTRAARKLVRNVIQALGGRGVPWLEYQAWRLASDLSLASGRRRVALIEADAAVQALERIQGRLLTETRKDFLADKQDVYEVAVALALEGHDHLAAFGYAERAKSRALVDGLAGELDIRIRPRTDQEQRLQDELTRLRRRHDHLASISAVGSALVGSAQTGEAEPAAPSVEELATCERQITRILEELRLASVADLERVAILQGQTFPLELDSESVLIEYFASGQDLYVFTQTHDGVTGKRLAGANARIERLATFLQLSMQTAAGLLHDPPRLRTLEPPIRQILGRLYRELIEPTAHQVRRAARLIVVPHGALHRVPFAALYDGSRYLVENYELVVGPSASALAFCRRPITSRKQKHLVVGCSNHGALPGVISEATRLADLLQTRAVLEEAATRDAFVGAANESDIIHIAAHGVARIDAPLFSHVQLVDGRLAALDCFDLELDCSLVTLSACESGRAQIAPGDEQLGLPRAFLYSGARSVVQTLWRVADDTTARLMERFYTGLIAGQGRARALREAQLHVLRDIEDRSHPFFWAPAVLVGDWSPVMHTNMTAGGRV